MTLGQRYESDRKIFEHKMKNVRKRGVLGNNYPKKYGMLNSVGMGTLGRRKSGGEDESIRAFTLIELLMTIAIVAVLAALIFPAINWVREGGRKASCLSNLRQIGVGLSTFASDNNGMVPRQNDGTIDDYNDAWVRLNETYWVSLGKLYEGGYIGLKQLYCPSDKYNYDGKRYDGGAIQSSYLYRSIYLADSLGSSSSLGKFAFMSGKVAALDDITWITFRPKPRPTHVSGINVLYFGGDVQWWSDTKLRASAYDRADVANYIKTKLDRK